MIILIVVDVVAVVHHILLMIGVTREIVDVNIGRRVVVIMIVVGVVGGRQLVWVVGVSVHLLGIVVVVLGRKSHLFVFVFVK